MSTTSPTVGEEPATDPRARAATAGSDGDWGGWNPLDPDQRENLYEHLRQLRESQPVNLSPLGLWRLTRYHDVVELLREAPAGVRTADGVSFLPSRSTPEQPRDLFMLFQDPPTHTRLRKLVSRAFTPRAIERTRDHIQAIVDGCLDTVAARGEIDVIGDLALPVPATVICEMLGVPVADRDRFTAWTADATHGISPNPFPDPAVLARADAAAEQLGSYFETLIAERRANLSDDLLSGFIRVEEEGDRLTTLEMLSQSVGLLIAGFETTIGLIGNGVRALIQHPDELAKLRARPELIGSAVEECLRWDGPIVATLRILHADARFGDTVIPKDAIVLGVLGAANHDPEVFPDPERFDIERSPNEHLAFGGGVHFCLGAHLARLEAQTAIGTLVRRFSDLELVSDEVEWGPSLFRVPGKLPVRFSASP